MRPAALTIALGRPVYVEMACAFARSFKLPQRTDDLRIAHRLTTVEDCNSGWSCAPGRRAFAPSLSQTTRP